MFKLFLSIIAVAVLLMAVPAMATNGYFAHGYDVQSKALGGAGVAYPQSSLSAATNPAGMVFNGAGYDINVSLFSPIRDFTVTGNPSGNFGSFGLMPGTTESGSNLFVVPAMGANWMINDISSFGISLYGNGGMNTNYESAIFYGSDPVGVNLSQMFFAPTYSRKIDDKHGFGLTGIFCYQWFSADGLEAFGMFSQDGTKLTNNDNSSSTGFGLRLGYLGKWFDGFTFGASYQSKIFMSEFDEYAGLFSEDGDFDIPSNWTVGIAADLSKKVTLIADVQTIYYSEIKAINNPLIPNIMSNPLGTEDGAGFGWEDMTTFKFGMEWKGIADMPIRLGYSYGQQPIPDEEVLFNILAPGVIEQHITFGFSRKLCKQKEINFAVAYALSNTVEGINPMDPVQSIELKMHEWEFTVGFGF